MQEITNKVTAEVEQRLSQSSTQASAGGNAREGLAQGAQSLNH